MDLPININDLITGLTVELERIEFKEDWNLENVIHTICAFANDVNNWGGGYKIIGINEDKGRPVLLPKGLAQETIDNIQKELLNLCNLLKPHFFQIAEPVRFQGKYVLVIWVFGRQNRSYRAPISLGKKKEYASYIKRFSSTVKAQFEDEKELMSLAGTIPYDDRICHLADISELKLPLIQSFLKEVESDLYDSANMDFEQLCWQMRIVDGTTEYVEPRNVGILFFNDLSQKFIPLSQIEIVQFKSTPGADRLSEKNFQGHIHQQIRDDLTYLKNTVLKEYIRKVSDRAESVKFYNYLYIALKETVVNAMYHRSYEIREPVEIRIHPDKIEILIFPGPDRSIKQSDLNKGILVARRYRNRRIGEFLKELKLTEGRCKGIPKIRKGMKSNGSLEPIFETDDERTYFLTTLMIHPEATISEQENPQVSPQENPQVSGQVSEQTSEHVSEQTSEQTIQILDFCKIARKKQEILNRIGLSTFYLNYKRYILPLIKKGFLSMTHPENPRHRDQKYVITNKYLKIYDKSN